MSIFFLMVFVIYGGMHAYVFVRARSAFAFNAPAGVLIAVFMLVMVLALFLIRALEQHEYEIFARVLAYLAYFWMAAVFLFFCALVTLDVTSLLIRAVGRLSDIAVSPITLSARASFIVSLILSLSVCLYGYFEARNVLIEKIEIETTKLPMGIDRLRIVQISDVHLGLIVRRMRLKQMLDAVKAANPDILVSTGDLVDAQINHLAGLAELLRDIKTKYGNYAVTGNHEYYAGLKTALEFTREAGFTILSNKALTVGPIIVAGVDDRTAVQLKLEQSISEKDFLATLPKNKFILFLKHQPRIDQSTIGLFDLQLSGHTHKGQIFPFTLLTKIIFPMIAGTYDLGNGSLLHISRGTGTWGPPIRFLAPPEITIIDVIHRTVHKRDN